MPHLSLRHRLAALLGVGALLASLSACGGGNGSDGSVSMTVATPTWNAGIASLAVSEDRGYFKDEGLDMNIVLTDSATTQAQQIATGKVATGAVSPEPVIIGDQPGKNLDLTYYMSYYKNNIYGLEVPEDSTIRSIEDLKGKTVGAISLSSASVTQAKVGLEEAGVPADSVKFVAIGVGGQQAAAVKNKQVDALALLDTSFQVLENQGIKLRPIEVPGAADLTSGGLVARSADLKKDPDLYTKIGRAIAKGVIFSEANPEAAIKILYKTHPEAKPSGLSDSQAVASGVSVLKSRLKNLGVEPNSQSYGALDPAMLRATAQFLQRAEIVETEVPVKDFYNDSLLTKINSFDADAVRKQAQSYEG